MKFDHLVGGLQNDCSHPGRKNAGDDSFFKKKYLRTAAVLGTALILYTLSARAAGFMPSNALTGIPAGLYWLIRNFFPSKQALTALPLILKTLLHTAVIAAAASTLAALIAGAAAIVSSQTTGRFRLLQISSALIASFFRNMPLPAWSMLLLLSFKQNEVTGFLALFFVTAGHLTRAFTEIIDTHTGESYTALEAAGVPYLAIIIHGVMPAAVPLFLSWLLYAIETNVRDSALIGILTGTGIGFLFNLYFKSFRYSEAGLIICVLMITVLCIDGISHAVRRALV
ncbi:MAG: ABC transporter permease subunit [Treponema sp.]